MNQNVKGPHSAVSDSTLRNRIDKLIVGKNLNPRATFEVSVENGVVELRGIVSDEDTRKALTSEVGRMPGVATVHNHLTTIEFLWGKVAPSPR
jgi:osmotically-inducible protein OsmY